MKQSDLNCDFKKEIDMDWDAADNCHGEPIDKTQRNITVRVVLEKLPDSVVKKYYNKKNADPDKAHPKFTQKCPRCKKQFKNKSHLSSHRSYCGKERNKLCAHCPYKTNLKANLIRHLSNNHSDGKHINRTKDDHSARFTKICKKCGHIAVALCMAKCERCLSTFFYRCNKCAKQFKTYSLANYHHDTRCGVKGYFNCPKCDFKSVWRSKVAHHMKQLHLIPESSGDFKNIKWLSLSDDNNKGKDSNVFQCPKCTKLMGNTSNLSRHILVCRGLECTKRGTKRSDIKNKINKNVHAKNGSDLIKCCNCEKQFNHVYSLNRHARHCLKKQYMTRVSNDSDVDVVGSDEDLSQEKLISADKRYTRYTKMTLRHCKKCNEDSAIEEKNWGIGSKVPCQKCKSTLLFKCKKCSKQYAEYPNMKNHLDTVCNIKEEYKCIKCNYKAHVPSLVKGHYNDVHANDNAGCKKCGKIFKSNRYLKAHLRWCQVEPKLQCEHCSYKAKMRIHLIRHIFSHHMELVVIDRNDAIKISKQRFSRAKIHLKAYCSKCKNEQPLGDRLKVCKQCETKLYYKCKTCKKKYDVDDENACDHVKGYLETIKFECKRCGRGAISKKSLWMHERTCGAEATFKCKFCKYAAKTKSNTKNHEKKVHPHKI